MYEIKESGNEEKALFAAVTRKHQIEADCVDGGLEAAAAVTMLLDALLSIFFVFVYGARSPSGAAAAVTMLRDALLSTS